jgi:hypothetical protein
MKKQLIRISVLQSSKIMTALYVLMGFIYTPIGIGMMVFGVRYGASEVVSKASATEVLCYGTAVVLTKM